jgi:hypothetical protein
MWLRKSRPAIVWTRCGLRGDASFTARRYRANVLVSGCSPAL